MQAPEPERRQSRAEREQEAAAQKLATTMTRRASDFARQRLEVRGRRVGAGG